MLLIVLASYCLALNSQMVEWINSHFVKAFDPSTILEAKNRI
jgi:hypothetical protein